MKNTFRSLCIPLVGAAVFCASTARSADASPITLQFTSTVQSINPLAAGFPGSLAGVNVGDPITGTLTFDPATVPAVNPFLGTTFGDATLYSLPTASFSVNIDGVLFSTWNGFISAFVWDNDSIAGVDGIIFTTIASGGNPLFQLGNLSLSSSKFDDESLPTGPLGPVFFLIGQNEGNFTPWIQSGPFTATEASTAPVPEPATLFLLGPGLAVAARRRFQR